MTREETLDILLTTYGLNNSHTKIIHVGLQRTNKGIFKPLVKLGHNADRIYFDTDCWQQFQDHIEFMNKYLSSDNRVKPNFVVIKNITISFTTSGQNQYCCIKKKKKIPTEIFGKKKTLTIQFHRRRNEEPT